jgi:hypothetical protein
MIAALLILTTLALVVAPFVWWDRHGGKRYDLSQRSPFAAV